MPALIGYLLTIAVFLGGGYAGMQWVTAPQDIPAAVAAHGSVEPVKSTRAKLLQRKRHEEAAEREANAKPTATAVPSAPAEAVPSVVKPDAVTARAGPVAVSNPVQREEISQPAAVADKPLLEVSSASKAAAMAGDKSTTAVASMQSEVPLDNRTATVGIAAPLAAPPLVQPIGEPKSAEKKTARSISPRQATESKRGRAAKRRATTRLASRKPVMMILRTIEFPDGRREQRLLPMPRYRQAFADDSDD